MPIIAGGKLNGLQKNMIDLQDQKPIAWSATRECFLHPEDPSKVIKIVHHGPVLGQRDANWQEWCHYRYIMQRHGHFDYIAEYYGFVETSRGRGLLLDCIRDHDGRISTRLDTVLKNPDKYDLLAVENTLFRLCRVIIEKNVQLFDLNLWNILIQMLHDGTYRPVAIDIKGRFNNYELIPVSSYIPFFSRRKLSRRCRRLMDRVRSVVGGAHTR